MVNAKTSNPKDNLPTEIWVNGLSCGVVIFPNKYKAQTPKMAIQIARKTSLSSKCNCNTKSAFDKNLNAKANSKKPKETFTVFNQPPDFGSECIQLGNIANNINGKAKAVESDVPTAVNAVPTAPLTARALPADQPPLMMFLASAI